jgi:predicted lactoylglutathione lyase
MDSHFPPAVPEIPVSHIDKAAEYYVQKLGFTLDWGDENGGIAGISKGQCRMFLTNSAFRAATFGNAAPVVTWLNANTRAEVTEWYEQWKAAGARLLSAPEEKPWKLFEFTAADEDGNVFRVFYDFGGEG